MFESDEHLKLQDNVIDEVKKLGFAKHTFSEVILTIKYEDIVNLAPIGVLLLGSNLYCKIYSNSKIYRFFKKGIRDCVLNITDDPIMFYNAIFEKRKVALAPSSLVTSPRVKECVAYVECRVDYTEDRRECMDVFMNPIFAESIKSYPGTYKRAGPAIIEALIIYTKIEHFKTVDRVKAEHFFEKIKTFREIVYHSSTKKEYRQTIDEILKMSEAILRS
ncbi:TPA: DUF447 family protein [Candidatus Bathyarchaeota archaeon]|nr:DUF447 family protein [Candidatus Bathyarchaeota archaeon]